MTTLLPHVEFELSTGAAVSLDGLAGWTVIALGGRIWLTEEMGGRDIWLLPGQRHRLVQPGTTVIETWPLPGAELPARIRLAPPAGAARRDWAVPRFRLAGVPACA